MKIVLLTLFLVLGFAEWAHIDASARMRQKLCNEWAAEDGETGEVYYYAAGFDGSTLVMVPNVDYGQADDDAYVSAATHGRWSRSLRAAGFRRVRCGQVEGTL